MTQRYNKVRLIEITHEHVKVWEEQTLIAQYTHEDDVGLSNIQAIMDYDYENSPYQEFDPTI